jgi:hypothetical protein
LTQPFLSSSSSQSFNLSPSTSRPFPSPHRRHQLTICKTATIAMPAKQSIPDVDFLMACIEHGEIKIDFAAVNTKYGWTNRQASYAPVKLDMRIYTDRGPLAS